MLKEACINPWKFKWFQLIHALPREWKEAISMHDGSLENLLIPDHHLIKKNQIFCLTKLNSNELQDTNYNQIRKSTSQYTLKNFLKTPI